MSKQNGQRSIAQHIGHLFTQFSWQQYAWFLFLAIVIGYTLWMSFEVTMRYDSFKATAFDLGNYDQAIWNTIHGRPFVFTNQGDNYYGPPTRLAFHFEPILLPISLLYLFHADPRILLIFQTLALASGAYPVFRLTRYYVPVWPLLAPMMVAAYLFSPASMGVNLFDFHPLSLVAPLLLYAILALVHRRYGWFLLACILAAACKEDVPLIVAMLGILVIWKYKLPRLGLLLLIGGLLWSFLAFVVIMPHFYPGVHYSNFWYRYEAWGSSPKDAILNILLHPWIIVTNLLTLDRIYYLFGLLRSSGFLALLAPEWLLPTLPTLAINLPSSDNLLYSGIYQYNAPVIPFIMLSALYGLQRAARWWYAWRGEQIKLPAVAALMPAEQPVTRRSGKPFLQQQPFFASIRIMVENIIERPVTLVQPGVVALARVSTEPRQRFSARMQDLAKSLSTPRMQGYLSTWLLAMIILNWWILTPKLNILWPDHLPGEREQQIQQLITSIPENASVSAGTNLNPHLTEREHVTVFPAITYVSSESGTREMVDYVVVDLQAVFPENKQSTASMLNQLLHSGQFCILKQADGVLLLKRCAP